MRQLFVTGLVLLLTKVSVAQLNDEIAFSGKTLELVEFTQLPNSQSRVISMTTMPGSSNLFVSAQQGTIFSVQPNSDGQNGTLETWFDVRAAVQTATGRSLETSNGGHGGLRAVAFHPEFETNGKFYTSMMQDSANNPNGLNFLGETESNQRAESVLAEWTYDHAQGTTPSDSYRELFRVGLPIYDHPIKQIKFNPFAEPTDDDYGLLYIMHGDAATQQAFTGGGQNLDEAVGKMLRINPLASGDQPYTTPGNPFADATGVLNEIYAYGFRNPHNLSFNLDSEGNPQILVADIGRNNIEEVNLVLPGENYGWSTREGTFQHNQAAGNVSALPANEAQNGFRFPVAQFDHSGASGGVAIAGGHVINNNSDPMLQGEYIFGEFSSTGHLYHANLEEMLSATTILDSNDPARDEPSELTQAQVSRLRIAFDDDQNEDTPPLMFDTITSMLGRSRSDIRFGRGPKDELYISSKQDRRVYLVTNTVPDIVDPVCGDFDMDGDVDAADRTNQTTNWTGALSGDGDRSFVDGDCDGDGDVDTADLNELIQNWTGAVAGNSVDVALTESNSGRLNQVVPEPTSVILALISLLPVFYKARGH